MIPLFQYPPRPLHPLLRWRVRPLFSVDGPTAILYGWNLIDPRGLVRRSFTASLNEVADVARREMKGMRV